MGHVGFTQILVDRKHHQPRGVHNLGLPPEAATNFWRTAGSSTTMNFHGWSPKEEGARTRDCSSAAQVAAGIFFAGSNFLVA